MDKKGVESSFVLRVGFMLMGALVFLLLIGALGKFWKFGEQKSPVDLDIEGFKSEIASINIPGCVPVVTQGKGYLITLQPTGNTIPACKNSACLVIEESGNINYEVLNGINPDCKKGTCVDKKSGPFNPEKQVYVCRDPDNSIKLQ